MKRTLSIAVSLLALNALAQEVEEGDPVDPPSQPSNVSSVGSANVFGLMMVSGSCRRYILPTPWCDFKPGVDASIVASNLLKTANLEVGDMLNLFDEAGNIYNSWKLAVEDGLRYWAPVSEVSEMGVASDSPSVSSKTSPQGYAFMLLRYGKDGSASGASSEFYLFGQVGHNSEVSGTTIPAGGTPEAPLMRLIACPKAADWCLNDLNDVEFQDGDYTGDMIRIAEPSGIITDFYWCKTSEECNRLALKVGAASGSFEKAGWYERKMEFIKEGKKPARVVTSFVLSTASISCAFGGWYVSYSGHSRTIKWNGVQKQ